MIIRSNKLNRLNLFKGEIKVLTKRVFKTKDETEVTFVFSQVGSKTVDLVADFNDWQPLPMKFNKNKKIFTTKVRLPNNASFHFRYLLNGLEWENDHAADAYIANSFGSENSVVLTQSKI
jgi:1,4-alpha-glucan branching enzyme